MGYFGTYKAVEIRIFHKNSKKNVLYTANLSSVTSLYIFLLPKRLVYLGYSYLENFCWVLCDDLLQFNSNIIFAQNVHSCEIVSEIMFKNSLWISAIKISG